MAQHAATPTPAPTPANAATRAFLREAELAERWGVSVKTLQRWRLTGTSGPLYVKFGRSVAYPLYGAGGVLEYESRFLYRSTSERAHFQGDQ